jgi:hypothetical protein
MVRRVLPQQTSRVTERRRVREQPRPPHGDRTAPFDELSVCNLRTNCQLVGLGFSVVALPLRRFISAPSAVSPALSRNQAHLVATFCAASVRFGRLGFKEIKRRHTTSPSPNATHEQNYIELDQKINNQGCEHSKCPLFARAYCKSIVNSLCVSNRTTQGTGKSNAPRRTNALDR